MYIPNMHSAVQLEDISEETSKSSLNMPSNIVFEIPKVSIIYDIAVLFGLKHIELILSINEYLVASRQSTFRRLMLRNINQSAKSAWSVCNEIY